MKVLRVPSRLRLATAVLGLILPLVVFNIVLASRTPWWNLPWNSLQIWLLVAIVIWMGLVFGIRAGQAWAYWLLVVLAAVWCVSTGVVAFRTSNPSLGFFAAALVAFWGVQLSWLRFEMSKSFFALPMRWFEGHPKPLPGAECRITWRGREEPELRARICRIDHEGFCAYAPGAFRLRPVDEAEMILTYRGKEVRCSASPMTMSLGGEGRSASTVMGFQFSGMTPDSRKDLGDFVETMRGEGHV